MDNTVLQKILAILQVDVLIVTGTDLHQLESTSALFKIRHILSQFTGSAGTFVIYSAFDIVQTALWTDARYDGIATKSVSDTTQVFISNEHDWESQIQWILDIQQSNNIHNASIAIGVSDLQINAFSYNTLSMHIDKSTDTTSNKFTLHTIPFVSILDSIHASMPQHSRDNDIHAIVNNNYPLLYTSVWNINLIQEQYPIKDISQFTSLKTSPLEAKPWGKSIQEHMDTLTQYLKKHQASVYVSANIHEIAWLLHIRSASMKDLMLFPCLFLYNIDTNTLSIWLDVALAFIHKQDIETQTGIKIQILPYSQCIYHTQTCKDIILNQAKDTQAIAYDERNIPIALAMPICNTIESPLTLSKSVRTPIEITHTTYTQALDNIALLEATSEIHELLQNGTVITEQDACDVLLQYRLQQPYFIQSSFSPISATGIHAATPHHKTSTTIIDPNVPYLLDSGAHYLYGTTDITRVYCFTTIDKVRMALFIDDYTYVLKAHIALACYKSAPITKESDYPTGKELDSIARNILLSNNRNYNHGTGHGIGYMK